MNQTNQDLVPIKQALQLCQQGKFERALQLLQDLERRHGSNAKAYCLMGSIFTKLGKYEDAIGNHQKALQLVPDMARACIGQAEALILLGRADKAESCYEYFIEKHPDAALVIMQLAKMLMMQGRYDEAIVQFKRLLEIDEKSEGALLNLGKIYQSLHKTELAKNYYDKLLGVNSGSSQGYYALGTLSVNRGDVEKAEKFYKRALELDSENVHAYLDLGYLYIAMNQPSLARELLQNALMLDPENPDVIAALAKLEDQSGNLDAAYDLVAPVIKRNISHAGIGAVYAGICHHFDRCHEAADYLERLLAKIEGEPMVEEKIHFALGKVYDRLSEYDRAFYHVKIANDQKTDYFNQIDHATYINDLIKTCDWNYFVSAMRSSQTSERPVFIVGMPSSGSTLTEQILASHPDVHGMGEINLMPNIIQHLQSYLGVGAEYPLSLKMLTPKILDSMAESYFEGIEKINPVVTLRFTDKTLINYMYLGLISQIFPKARIIHCVRDPRDVCISIYFQNFDESHHYANRLCNLGIYYNYYKKLIDHWKSLLNISIMEIRYEDMVRNQEKTSRELIDFVGLEWDERVLRFHNLKRSVVTASYDQVRQKIYTKSTGRWKNYEKHISQLVNAFDFPLS